MDDQIPDADPELGFKVRVDRAIDELEAAVKAYTLSIEQSARIEHIIAGGMKS